MLKAEKMNFRKLNKWWVFLPIDSGNVVRKLSDTCKSVNLQNPIEFGNSVNWFWDRSINVKFVNLLIDYKENQK